MEQYCTDLYNQLQTDIAVRKNSQLPCLQKIESCFRLAWGRWLELSKKLRHHQFASEESEVRFFKILKPMITGEIEYYQLVYQALLFAPEKTDARVRFWKWESERLERFKDINHFFVQCYEGQRQEMQGWYFLRKYYNRENAVDIRIYEADAALSANGDAFVATLLALKKYREHAGEKLKSL